MMSAPSESFAIARTGAGYRHGVMRFRVFCAAPLVTVQPAQGGAGIAFFAIFDPFRAWQNQAEHTGTEIGFFAEARAVSKGLIATLNIKPLLTRGLLHFPTVPGWDSPGTAIQSATI